MALYYRELHGEGDVIEVPLASALGECLIYNSMEIGSIPERYKCLREREIERREKAGIPLNLSYNGIKELLDPFYSTYKCEDGRFVYLVAPCHAIHQKRALKILGIWDEVKGAGIPEGDVYSHSDEWNKGGDFRMFLGTYPITSPTWITRLKTLMADAFLKRPAADWERLFGAVKVPGCKVGPHMDLTSLQ